MSRDEAERMERLAALTPDAALARRLHRELRALPAPPAPATLLPRILAAVDRPWYSRAWLTWPETAQLASAIALVALVGGLVWLANVAQPLEAVSTLVRIGWRVLLQPVVGYVFAVAVLMSLAVSASWAALSRVALGGFQE